VVHKHLILDVDDDISAAKHEPRKIGLYGKLLLEHPEKFKKSIKYYDGVICGSVYMKEKVLSYHSSANVTVVPTCVNYEKTHTKEYTAPQPITLGWAGTSYNLPNLELIIPYLEQLHSKQPFKLLVICNEPFSPATNFEIENMEWNEDWEARNLLKID